MRAAETWQNVSSHTHSGGGFAYLLVYGNVNLDACLGASLEHLIQPVLLVVERWALQEQLWAKPPIRDVDGLLGLLQGLGNSPEVISTIDIPFDQVAVSLGRKALEAVAFGNLAPLGICLLLVLLVMAMVGIEEVGELAQLVLDVDSFDVDASQLGVLELLLDLLDLFREAVVKRMKNLLKALFFGHGAGRAQRSAASGGVREQRQRWQWRLVLGLGRRRGRGG